jgi:hypothetical protein
MPVSCVLRHGYGGPEWGRRQYAAWLITVEEWNECGPNCAWVSRSCTCRRSDKKLHSVADFDKGMMLSSTALVATRDKELRARIIESESAQSKAEETSRFKQNRYL